MSLASGMRVGPYEVLGSLGAGGMGEVYRARDTRLNRDVAIKVLPDAFATDPERLARFEREAQVLAVAQSSRTSRQIYGLEDAGGIARARHGAGRGEPTLAERARARAAPARRSAPIARADRGRARGGARAAGSSIAI